MRPRLPRTFASLSAGRGGERPEPHLPRRALVVRQGRRHPPGRRSATWCSTRSSVRCPADGDARDATRASFANAPHCPLGASRSITKRRSTPWRPPAPPCDARCPTRSPTARTPPARARGAAAAERRVDVDADLAHGLIRHGLRALGAEGDEGGTLETTGESRKPSRGDRRHQAGRARRRWSRR